MCFFFSIDKQSKQNKNKKNNLYKLLLILYIKQKAITICFSIFFIDFIRIKPHTHQKTKQKNEEILRPRFFVASKTND